MTEQNMNMPEDNIIIEAGEETEGHAGEETGEEIVEQGRFERAIATAKSVFGRRDVQVAAAGTATVTLALVATNAWMARNAQRIARVVKAWGTFDEEQKTLVLTLVGNGNLQTKGRVRGFGRFLGEAGKKLALTAESSAANDIRQLVQTHETVLSFTSDAAVANWSTKQRAQQIANAIAEMLPSVFISDEPGASRSLLSCALLCAGFDQADIAEWVAEGVPQEEMAKLVGEVQASNAEAAGEQPEPEQPEQEQQEDEEEEAPAEETPEVTEDETTAAE
jgi:hypothetical protein